MSNPTTTEHAFLLAPNARPRTEVLLPPAIILLVFAMVVTAVAGFAYVGGQQSMLSVQRQQSEAMREAVITLERTNASVAQVLTGNRGAMAHYFRNAETLRAQRPATFDTLSGAPAALDQLAQDWGEATTLGADGHADHAMTLLTERQTDAALTNVIKLASDSLVRADAQLEQHEGNIRLGTLAVLLLQVVGGALAIATLFFAFRSSAREADGRSAALKSADTSREQVVRLFQMADVLQSATDYGDANQVLKATAAELLPGFAGALYVFNNSRDRLVLSTSWGREGAPAENISPDHCWALKRGKPHVNNAASSKLCCEHHHDADIVLEIPMIARGEIMGLFQLYAPGENGAERLEGITELGTAIADGMSLALANMGLREKLRNQALRDPLTGLYNRRYMEDCLQRFVRLADRENREVSVIMVDLDHFKRLNDEHGHAFGDSILRDTATTIISALRETDIVCRYGGEELVVILPDCNLERAADKAEILRQRIEALGTTHGTPISASFGVASVPYTSSGVVDLLGASDGALYKAKQAGRNRVEIAPRRPFQLDRLEDELERSKLIAAE
ncbi:MAG: GGDEF domain-containing protein [Hyphomicrobiales bacterium]|nr:MAG: GGDEF domain-containing protein [Hyphomicrobiales bacterium]